MVTVLAGAALGWVVGAAAELTGMMLFQAIMIGASIGSLFVQTGLDDSSSPTYSMGSVHNTMSQNLPIPIIYGGEMRVAGNIIYQAFDSDEKRVQTLYIALSEGEIESVRDVMGNDQLITDLPDCSLTVYKNTTLSTRDSRDPTKNHIIQFNDAGKQYIDDWYDLEWDEQVAALDHLVASHSNWSWVDASSYKTKRKKGIKVIDSIETRPYPNDIALLCMTLTASEKLSGTPTITSIVKGIKVWTPNGVKWSDNPIWCAVDLLANSRYGMGLSVTDSTGTHPDWSKIDYASAVAAANYCDGLVDGEKRFTLTYVLDTQKGVREVLTEMLQTCRGYMTENEKIEFHIEAAVSNYTREITEANIVQGSFSWWQKTDNDTANQISLTWTDPNSNYDQVTDYYQNVDDIRDRGIIQQGYTIVGIARQTQANRMGYYLLKTNLLVKNLCSFRVGIKDCDILPGEVIAITYPSFTGWNKKWFRVISIKVESETEITVTCGEYIADCYNDGSIAVVPHIDTQRNLNIPNVTDLTIEEAFYNDEKSTASLWANISWDIDGNANSYELSYKFPNTPWIGIGTVSSAVTNYRLNCDGHNGEELQFRVVTVSPFGRKSSGVTAKKVLNARPPSDVTGFQAVQDGNYIDLMWDRNPQWENIDHYEVRKGFVWSASQLIGETTNNNLSIPAYEEGGYNFLVKAVDKNGVYSLNPASTAIYITDLQPRNVLVIYDGLNVLWSDCAAIRWEDVTDKTWDSLFEGEAENVTFRTSPQTWGQIGETWESQTARAWNEFAMNKTLALVDGATDGYCISDVHDLNKVVKAQIMWNIGCFIGEGDVVSLEWRSSVDGITWTQWSSITDASATLRYIQWRVTLHRENLNSKPFVTAISIRVDMPDVQKTGKATVEAGGSYINFGFSFAQKPILLLTAEGGDVQAYYSDIDLTTDGVTVEIKNKENQSVGGTVNWSAYGY